MVTDLTWEGFPVETYALLGHTPGTMVMLIPEEKILILEMPATMLRFLLIKNSYRGRAQENLIQIQNRLEGRFDTTCLCHHVIWAKDRIRSVIEVCDTIMKDQADDVPFNFYGAAGLCCKKANEYFNRLDGGEAISSTVKKNPQKEVTP